MTLREWLWHSQTTLDSMLNIDEVYDNISETIQQITELNSQYIGKQMTEKERTDVLDALSFAYLKLERLREQLKKDIIENGNELFG